MRVRELAGARGGIGNISVLLLGETGVGKEVLARADPPRVAARRAAVPRAQLRGARRERCSRASCSATRRARSPAPSRRKPGLLETADGGTVFLDEIGELPLPTAGQAPARARGRARSCASAALEPAPIDVRFVAATNRDLEAEVARGTLPRAISTSGSTASRSTIPPLRERAGGDPRLARRFLAARCRAAARGAAPRVVARRRSSCCGRYRWPGNIRELRNVVERAVLLCDGASSSSEHLPLEKMRPSASMLVPAAGSETPPFGMPAVTSPPGASDDPERDRILKALADHAGNQTRAARALQMPRRTFVARLDRYGIQRPRK